MALTIMQHHPFFFFFLNSSFVCMQISVLFVFNFHISFYPCDMMIKASCSARVQKWCHELKYRIKFSIHQTIINISWYTGRGSLASVSVLFIMCNILNRIVRQNKAFFENNAQFIMNKREDYTLY